MQPRGRFSRLRYVELAYQPPVEIGLAGDVGAKIGAALGTGMEHLRSSPAHHPTSGAEDG
jgi:hypothetical protein